MWCTHTAFFNRIVRIMRQPVHDVFPTGDSVELENIVASSIVKGFVTKMYNSADRKGKITEHKSICIVWECATRRWKNEFAHVFHGHRVIAVTNVVIILRTTHIRSGITRWDYTIIYVTEKHTQGQGIHNIMRSHRCEGTLSGTTNVIRFIRRRRNKICNRVTPKRILHSVLDRIT